MISSKRVYQLMSVLIALSLWIYVVAEENIFQERVVTVDVKYENLAESLTPSAKMPNVTVRIRGDQNLIHSVRPADFTAVVDLKGATIGEKEYEVFVTPPAGVRLVSVSPQRIFLDLEEKAEKQVPVRATVIGTTMEGFSSFEPVMKTSHVTIRGPASVVRLAEYATADVNLDNASMNLSLKVAPVIRMSDESADASLLSIKPDVVDIFVPVIEDNPSKSVPVRVRVTGIPAYGYSVARIVTDPEIIRISGANDRIDSITEIQTQFIDITNLSEDITKEVALVIPPDVQSTYEDNIRVTIIFEKNVVEKRIVRTLAIKNVPEGFELQASQNQISVVLRGEELDFRDFLAESLDVYVNAEAYSAGNREFTVQTSRPEKLEILDISPSTVTLTRSNR